MANENLLSKQITSLDELKDVLQNWSRPNLNELNHREFHSLLCGFRIIVEGFEAKKDLLEISIRWLQLYLEVQTLIITSESKLKSFYKTVPIVITYITGWFQQGPKDSTKFFNEILSFSIKLVQLVDPNELKKIEQFGQGVIGSIWLILDYVGSYDIQFQVILLIFLLLKNLSEDFQYQEISKMVNEETDELKYIVFDLMKQKNINDIFKNLVRKILNLHNESRGSAALVLSFHCGSLYLGKDLKFTKPSYMDCLWFDVNLKVNTLTFEARHTSRKKCNVHVSLKPIKISIGSKKVIIRFEAPADIVDSNFNLQYIELAYIEQITKNEIKRFENVLLGCDFGKSRIQENCFFDLNNRHNSINEQVEFLKQELRPSRCSIRPNIQEVKRLKTPLDYWEEEFGSKAVNSISSPEICDEYDDLVVSDAEPCQSYKNFQTNRPELFEDLKSETIAEKTKKQKAPETNSPVLRNKKQKININANEELSFEPSTSKAASFKRKIENNKIDAFDVLLKNDVPPLKIRRLSAIENIDLNKNPIQSADLFMYKLRSDIEISSDDVDLKAIKKIVNDFVNQESSDSEIISDEDESLLPQKLTTQLRSKIVQESTITTTSNLKEQKQNLKFSSIGDDNKLTDLSSDDDEPLSKYLTRR